MKLYVICTVCYASLGIPLNLSIRKEIKLLTLHSIVQFNLEFREIRGPKELQYIVQLAECDILLKTKSSIVNSIVDNKRV